MISRNYITILRSYLNSKYTSADDFSIDPVQEYEEVIIKITYRYDSSIYMHVVVDKTGTPYSASFAPGNLLSIEEVTLQTNKLISYVSQWTSNIDAELKSNPIVQKIEQQDKIIDEIFDLFKGYDKDETFNPEEVEDVKGRLDALEARMESYIKENYARESEQQNIINELKRDIEKLKIQSNNFTKKNWIISYITKFYTLIEKHPKLSALAASLIYGGLPEEVKQLIPDAATQLLLPSSVSKEDESSDDDSEK
ncbi:hypothetical protein JMA_22300 [Jeotgalibacillus malaysiensis]|uniref:Uncharacterized protein n=1 Tax=Jeotgalibacillus malaysiensis TaxID=1508404 RepID=A0A0B5AS82_9BACL|nr:hypothetical protein [Jeotgalibacillus malaysiensis]AJD91547.1 hypothetical protein JMA_22300 [Jeotgalibacillus malaysiensis]